MGSSVPRAPLGWRAIQRRHMRVVGGCRKTESRPGSRRMLTWPARQFMPGGTIQNFGRDIHGPELRLRQAHPVPLPGTGLRARILQPSKVLWQQRSRASVAAGFVGIEGRSRVQVPAFLSVPACRGSPEQCLLGFGLRIGIFYGHAQWHRVHPALRYRFRTRSSGRTAGSASEHGHPSNCVPPCQVSPDGRTHLVLSWKMKMFGLAVERQHGNSEAARLPVLHRLLACDASATLPDEWMLVPPSMNFGVDHQILQWEYWF